MASGKLLSKLVLLILCQLLFRLAFQSAFLFHHLCVQTLSKNASVSTGLGGAWRTALREAQQLLSRASAAASFLAAAKAPGHETVVICDFNAFIGEYCPLCLLLECSFAS